MKIIVENDRKIMLTDESRDSRYVMWLLIITIGLGNLFLDVHSTGLIPGSELNEIAISQGRSPSFRELLEHYALWLAVGGVTVGLLYEFLHTIPVVVLDKVQGKLVLNRMRWRTRTSRTIREVELKQVRCARIGDHEDMCRLEFELTSGELLAPNRNYSSEPSRPTLFSLVEEINKFLNVNLEVIKDAERSVWRT